MNFVLWLILSLLCVSVGAYKNEGDEPIRPNSSVYLDCFDPFIPWINRLTTEAKETSAACVASADAQKERELVSINRTRSELGSEVKRIKETLSACSVQKDHFGYFECLKGILETDRKIVGDITMKSSKYSNKIKEIEEQQIKCFRNAVFKIKEKSSSAIHSLQTCLTSSGENLGGNDLSSTTRIERTTEPFFHLRDKGYNRIYLKK
ncbi:uncharacterized protein LOC129951897 [Eupeodes corollae]|uniref:uncharacterized protein LOC129951897 n=1 Tax=Eupeodes corollae TaxID=290404 RepID=UPI002490F408|nr:uncharacterized protein LOC129951897 [Eupeodes corollae]